MRRFLFSLLCTSPSGLLGVYDDMQSGVLVSLFLAPFDWSRDFHSVREDHTEKACTFQFCEYHFFLLTCFSETALVLVVITHYH